MKHLFFIITILVLSITVEAHNQFSDTYSELTLKHLSDSVNTNTEADKIIGTWLNDTKEAQIEIFEQGLISWDDYLKSFEDYLKAEVLYLNALSDLYNYYAAIISRTNNI